MTKLTISIATLFEYVTYNVVLSTEKDYYSENSRTLHLTEETLNELEKINKTNKFLDIGRKTLKPRNCIGVVKAGSITIEILPKLFKDDRYEQHRAVIARNLLKMLSYSEKLSLKEIDSADLDTEELDFFEIFIYFFAKNLNELIKSTQRREYIKNSEELRFIRERIDTRRYTNPARLHIIPCNYHELSIDTTLNRTLKYTCYLMSRMVKNFNSFRLLRSISGILDSVTLYPVSLAEIDRISFTRLNRKFEPFIRICRIFLSHSTLTLQASDVETFSLLIPMETLFEEFIAKVIKEDPDYFFGPQTSVSTQQYIGKLASSEDGSGVFNLQPDIVIKRGPDVAIIDTKYKLLDDEKRKYGVSQADMYQMYAYVTKKDAISSMLLYPDTELKEQRTFYYNLENEGKRSVPLYITSIKLSYDLTNEKEWSEFRKDLRNVLTKFFPNLNLLGFTKLN
ncbi:McrC family protein [Methanosarcina mazei]|uniref:McrBC 5-methylcytosine restriction system component n=5 Tax=Methanosarcina mazei TaxID=2209 RepID=A0A0E3RIM5_METMZ|nr:McrC family protein [Methanosarcina mazei]AKB64357.1 McrBC 5-methylcytosine restriction system component [Methanosarcina mazei S-6]AKB67698.1 McrBC 5-methylcytosine restriction system component [Methanosarcina mazei LYC]MDO5838766.1 McrC family protein [Methanosarcina mazei]